MHYKKHQLSIKIKKRKSQALELKATLLTIVQKQESNINKDTLKKQTHLSYLLDGGPTIFYGGKILKYIVLEKVLVREKDLNNSDTNTNIYVYLRITKANETPLQ